MGIVAGGDPKWSGWLATDVVRRCGSPRVSRLNLLALKRIMTSCLLLKRLTRVEEELPCGRGLRSLGFLLAGQQGAYPHRYK